MNSQVGKRHRMGYRQLPVQTPPYRRLCMHNRCSPLGLPEMLFPNGPGYSNSSLFVSFGPLRRILFELENGISINFTRTCYQVKPTKAALVAPLNLPIIYWSLRKRCLLKFQLHSTFLWLCEKSCLLEAKFWHDSELIAIKGCSQVGCKRNEMFEIEDIRDVH